MQILNFLSLNMSVPVFKMAAIFQDSHQKPLLHTLVAIIGIERSGGALNKHFHAWKCK